MDIAEIRKRKEQAEAEANKLQAFAMELLDDFSLHFMDKERTAQVAQQKLTVPKPPRKVETARPTLPSAALAVKAVTTDAAQLAKIAEAMEGVLDNMDDYIDAPNMAVKLLTAGFHTELPTQEFAHAVREAFQILTKRLPIEIQTKSGVGRLYRLKR